MSLWTILPVKPFEEAKTRLAGELSPEQRCDLAAKLFARTLATVLSFAGERPVLVVTRSERIAASARESGALAMPELAAGGLNAALRQAAEYVRRHGGSQLLAVATDLPLLTTADLEEIAGTRRSGYGVAPDRYRSGTNALIQPVSRAPIFAFGPSSYLRHLQAVRKRGAEPVTVIRTGLALDLDGASDLAALASHGRGGFDEIDLAIQAPISRHTTAMTRIQGA